MISARVPLPLVLAAFAKATERDWAGDCYAVALEFFPAVFHLGGGESTRLVHGTPVLRGNPDGPRIGHAWIECEIDGVQMVYDLTVQPMPVLREAYYRCGLLDAPDAVVVKFDKSQYIARLRDIIENDEQNGDGTHPVGSWDPRVGKALHNEDVTA